MVKTGMYPRMQWLIAWVQPILETYNIVIVRVALMIFVVCFRIAVSISEAVRVKPHVMIEIYTPGIRLQKEDKPRYKWIIAWFIVSLLVSIAVLLELCTRIIQWCQVWNSRSINRLKYQKKGNWLKMQVKKLDIKSMVPVRWMNQGEEMTRD